MAVPLHPLAIAGAISTAAICVATDLTTRRIPNVVTGPAMLTGTTLNWMLFGTAGLATGLGGLGLGLLILTPPFALGGIRGGDVKMMGSIGAFVGPWHLFVGLIVGLMLGGIVATAAAARRGRLGETLSRTWRMVRDAALTASAEPLKEPTTLPGGILLPYSVPLALGMVATIGWTLLA